MNGKTPLMSHVLHTEEGISDKRLYAHISCAFGPLELGLLAVAPERLYGNLIAGI